jgi:predicted transcriptional regulator
MLSLRSHRSLLRISQSNLARLSGVSRFKICLYELGDGHLTPDEQNRIREALTAEAARLRSVPDQIALDQALVAEPLVEVR